jgi:hypothetical protein
LKFFFCAKTPIGVVGLRLSIGKVAGLHMMTSFIGIGSRWPTYSLFVRLISHQPAVLFSQNKPTTSNQPAVLFSHNKSALAISHQPNEQTVVNASFPFAREDKKSSCSIFLELRSTT